MIPEIGQFALILALVIAIIQAVLPQIGAARGIRQFIALARPAAQAQFIFVAIAFCCLGYSFISNDFSVLNVFTNSNSQLPLHYRLAATWGSHEGSLLLWTLMLSFWMVAVTLFSKRLPDEMVARVLAVMATISTGFLLFMLLTSNPFARAFPVPPDGQDLNPLLQDPAMVAHPPMLYMGYVGFSVAFAFAISALIGGRLDATWARWSRPWTTVAWMFLTCGIALGSFWAYYELGWGGWWFWDPVENASFMPWLVGTALIHSLAVTEKRGGFRSWTVLLAIVTFALSLLGTFLVRSGVLTSVHAFAVDPARGVFILALFVLLIGGALVLFAWRPSRIRLGGSFELASREAALPAHNVLPPLAPLSGLPATPLPPARPCRHGGGASGRRGVRRRRDPGEGLRSREGPEDEARRLARARRLYLPPRGRVGGRRAELPRRARQDSGEPRRQAGHRALSREARLHRAGHADDRGRHRSRPDARPLRLARRSARRRVQASEGAAQALRRLDLGRLPDHGARRPARGERPALSRRSARAARCGGHGVRIAAVIAVFLALIVLLALGLRLDPREVPSPLIGKPAPHFDLPVLQQPGKTFSEKDLQGRVWILNVWASWCVACRDEHPVLVEFSKSAAAPLYGLNYKDSRDDALGWLKRFGDPYRLSAFDLDGRIGIDYGVYGVPET